MTLARCRAAFENLQNQNSNWGAVMRDYLIGTLLKAIVISVPVFLFLHFVK